MRPEADLTAAEILAAAETHDYFTCAFHCQQAAEKFLKAYLVRHQIEFRKTHDLDQPLGLVSQAEPVLQEELASCGWLSPFGAYVRALRERGVKIARNQELQIQDVLYLGDEGGISCNVKPFTVRPRKRRRG